MDEINDLADEPAPVLTDAVASELVAARIPLPNLPIDSGEQSVESGEAFTCDADSDVNKDAPICIGMDYNANINWIVAGQPDGRRLNVIKSFYVKFERKIPEVVADFCTYYASHRNKTVVYYYDTTALVSNYAVNEQDFRWVVVHDCSCQ